MRSKFVGHFKEDDQTIKILWDTAIFVFDANVLLNLYRYSNDTRTDFLNLLEQIKGRIWLPEQAAHEFLKNRASVISQQSSSYSDTTQNIENLNKSFSGTRGHPFISKANQESLNKAISAIQGELEESKKAQEALIISDPIKDKVADLFEERVGDCFSDDEWSKVFENGQERYDSKTPPGYKDNSKHPDPQTLEDKRSKFGDWIIWRQVLDHAKQNTKPVILITDDRKEDWWERPSGKTLGPRPELIKEFVETSQQKILIYTPENFLISAKDHLESKVKTGSIDEVTAEQKARKRFIVKKQPTIRTRKGDLQAFPHNFRTKSNSVNAVSSPEIFTRRTQAEEPKWANMDRSGRTMEKGDSRFSEILYRLEELQILRADTKIRLDELSAEIDEMQEYAPVQIIESMYRTHKNLEAEIEHLNEKIQRFEYLARLEN